MQQMTQGVGVTGVNNNQYLLQQQQAQAAQRQLAQAQHQMQQQAQAQAQAQAQVQVPYPQGNYNTIHTIQGLGGYNNGVNGVNGQFGGQFDANHNQHFNTHFNNHNAALQQQQQQQQQQMMMLMNGNGVQMQPNGTTHSQQPQQQQFAPQVQRAQKVREEAAAAQQQAQAVEAAAQPAAKPPPQPSKRRKSKKKRKHHEMAREVIPIDVEPPKPRVSLEEILQKDEHSTKLRGISERDQVRRGACDADKMRKKRILKGLPFQLQQEIMNDQYKLSTPRLLAQYLEHEKAVSEKGAEGAGGYYPHHYKRMKDKAKKDQRMYSLVGKMKRRAIRKPSGQSPMSGSNGSTSPTTKGKKKAPAYLRVASPEVLEKMHFTKNDRSAITLEHVVTKQYRNRGRKSGFFGRKRNRKMAAAPTPAANATASTTPTPATATSTTPKASEVAKPAETEQKEAVPTVGQSAEIRKPQPPANVADVSTAAAVAVNAEQSVQNTHSVMAESQMTQPVQSAIDVQTAEPVVPQPMQPSKDDGAVHDAVTAPTVASTNHSMETASMAPPVDSATDTHDAQLMQTDPAADIAMQSLQRLQTDPVVAVSSDQMQPIQSMQADPVAAAEMEIEVEMKAEEQSVTPKLKSVSLEIDQADVEAKAEEQEPAAPSGTSKVVQRAWTKTNPETGQRDERLHRKDTVEMQQMQQLPKSEHSEPTVPTVLAKQSPQRLWTKTNPESGEKEDRLHRKDTQEMNELMPEVVSEAKDEEIVEPAQVPQVQQAKQSPQRAWTKTNPETGDRDDRLHRKDTEEMQMMPAMDVDVEVDAPQMTDATTESDEPQKAQPQRLWTKTDPETGEKQDRLHRKDTVEMDEDLEDIQEEDADVDGSGPHGTVITMSQEF